jgi:hypothetical protein
MFRFYLSQHVQQFTISQFLFDYFFISCCRKLLDACLLLDTDAYPCFWVLIRSLEFTFCDYLSTVPYCTTNL